MRSLSSEENTDTTFNKISGMFAGVRETAVPEVRVTTVAERLAAWAVAFTPSDDDLALARRSLVDTVAVALAAHDDPLVGIVAGEPPAARWATLGHVLDFDDLHMESTSHISVVCVPAVLAAGGTDRDYLVAA